MKNNKKEKAGWAASLVFMLYVVILTILLQTDDVEAQDEAWLGALLLILIVSFTAMIVPLICRVVNRKKFSPKGCKIICALNSVFLFVGWSIYNCHMYHLIDILKEVDLSYSPDRYVFLILLALSFGLSLVIAVVYYFVNKWIFESEENPKSIKKDNRYKCDNCGAMVSEDETECPGCGAVFVEDEPKKETKFKCDNCGAMVPESAKECPNCGEAFEDEIVDEYDDINSLYETAEDYKKAGYKKRAIESYKKYIEETERLMKESEDKCFTFGNSIEFVLAVKKDLTGGKCIDMNYRTSDAYLNLAAMAFDDKDYEIAIKHLNKSLKYNPINIAALFEMAEVHKVKGELDKYLNWTEKCYDRLYYISQLAHYYRNLGYYYIEKKKWKLAQAVYLYSLKYEDNSIVDHELEYISQKTNNDELPKKDELSTILRENDIPTFINKENLKIIKDFHKSLEEKNQLNTNVGKFVTKITKENANL